MLPVVVLFAALILALNACWLSLHLLRRVRSLEMRVDDHEQRIDWEELHRLHREIADADYRD